MESTRRRAGPRTVAAVALAVLATCGVVVLTTPLRPGSLVSRSNWVLATALPSRQDFPANWNYTVYGPLGWASVPSTPESSARDQSRPTTVYSPAGCGDLPEILSMPGTPAAYVRVDQDTDPIRKAIAAWPDAAATGDTGEPGPAASLAIRAVADGPALITNYLGWLRRCGSYRVAIYHPDSQQDTNRFVTTTVDARETAGEAAVTVTRVFTDIDEGGAAPSTYHVSYYTVRGLLLECSTSMTGSDVDLVTRLAGPTLRKLHAL